MIFRIVITKHKMYFICEDMGSKDTLIQAILIRISEKYIKPK